MCLFIGRVHVARWPLDMRTEAVLSLDTALCVTRFRRTPSPRGARPGCSAAVLIRPVQPRPPPIPAATIFGAPPSRPITCPGSPARRPPAPGPSPRTARWTASVHHPLFNADHRTYILLLPKIHASQFKTRTESTDPVCMYATCIYETCGCGLFNSTHLR